MSHHSYAMPPAVISLVASLLSVLASWLISLPTSGAISIPPAFVPLIGLFTAGVSYGLAYALHWLRTGDPTPPPPLPTK